MLASQKARCVPRNAVRSRCKDLLQQCAATAACASVTEHGLPEAHGCGDAVRAAVRAAWTTGGGMAALTGVPSSKKAPSGGFSSASASGLLLAANALNFLQELYIACACAIPHGTSASTDRQCGYWYTGSTGPGVRAAGNTSLRHSGPSADGFSQRNGPLCHNARNPLLQPPQSQPSVVPVVQQSDDPDGTARCNCPPSSSWPLHRGSTAPIHTNYIIP